MTSNSDATCDDCKIISPTKENSSVSKRRGFNIQPTTMKINISTSVVIWQNTSCGYLRDCTGSFNFGFDGVDSIQILVL